MGPRRPMAERQIVQRWSFDEREHIKKYLLLYGYGRWKKIITASKDADISISHRKLEEIRAYSNAFVRSICDNLTFDKYELKLFQLNIIKEGPDDPYVPVNSKDWDLNLIRQRANPWGKRLQLLYRVYLFVDEFKKYYSNKYGKKPSNVFHFKNLLNFLSGQMLLGQRPSVWWTRNHDIDQIVGTCRFGYANYQTMKNCEEFGFNELEKTCSYQEFPNADTITRRLKKLIQLIVRHEQSTAKFDFDALDNDDNELEEFSKEEKRDFFNCLFDYGVPISDDGKYNWHGLREKFYSANAGYTPKSISSIEKLVQHFRIVCQQIIQENRALENQEDLNDPKTDQEIEKNDMTDQENLEYQNDENQYNTNWKNQQTNGADQVQNGLIPVSGNGTNHVGKNSKGSQERRSGLDNYDDGERMDEEDLQDDKSDSQNMVDNMKDQIIDEMTEGNCDLNKLPQKNDSDRKDINITLEEAKRFHMNTNMLHFIRRYILFSQRALFKNSIEDFTKFASELDESHPAYISDVNYLPSTQDLGLLMCSAENGLDSLKSIKTGMYGFEMIHLSNEKIFGRLDFLCEFFKNQHNRTNLKKRKVDKNFRDESKKKLKNVIQVDDNGEIIFPIVISTSLKLQSLGVIKPGPFYHSEHNLFPVGYKSLRVYASIFNKGEKAEYTCEIIDGGDKPLYRVTSSEDPDHPIVRVSLFYKLKKLGKLYWMLGPYMQKGE